MNLLPNLITHPLGKLLIPSSRYYGKVRFQPKSTYLIGKISFPWYRELLPPASNCNSPWLKRKHRITPMTSEHQFCFLFNFEATVWTTLQNCRKSTYPSSPSSSSLGRFAFRSFRVPTKVGAIDAYLLTSSHTCWAGKVGRKNRTTHFESNFRKLLGFVTRYFCHERL